MWLYSWSHNSTSGSDECLYLLDWRTGNLKAIFTEAEDFDFWPKRATYAFVSQRNLSTYHGNHVLFTALAHVGNWKTGQQWTIVKGLVEATSISLRP